MPSARYCLWRSLFAWPIHYRQAIYLHVNGNHLRHCFICQKVIYYSNVTCASWRLSQTTITSTVQEFVQIDSKKTKQNMKLHMTCFLGGNPIYVARKFPSQKFSDVDSLFRVMTSGCVNQQCRFPSYHSALTFSLIYVWTNVWINNRNVSNLRYHHAHYGVTVVF